VKQIRKRLTYANVMSSIAVFLVLGGGAAYAAKKIGANELKSNSVKTGKIVKEAVTTSKLKNSSVTTAKIAKDAVTGEKANESTFSQVPSAASATNAANAANADKVGGHSAACPGGTTLIRGLCFDSVSNSPVSSVFAASEKCREKGGFLPTPLELRSTNDILDLGNGVGSNHQYTDSFYLEGGSGTTVIVEDGGGFKAVSTIESEEYICVYQLVR
jgi:hypothetical protein